MPIRERLKYAWNAFRNKDPTTQQYQYYGPAYSYRPDRVRFSRGNERSIVTAVYNRIAMDAASCDIRHVMLDENGRYKKDVDSNLNNCLTLEANIDQAARAFRQDIFMSMLDEGCIAIVPTDLDDEPDDQSYGSLDIFTMRVAQVLEWYPRHVRVRIFREETGEKEELVLPKSMVCLPENPLYAVVNEPSSTMQRLIRKLNLLDAVDEQSSSGKLDLIIQLPYIVKTPTRKKQAEERRKDIEKQLSEGKYGIAYTDGTERITQLNRPVENNLMKQIEYLTSMLYSQLGITQSILDGSADDQTMLNYYNRTIEPLLTAVVEEMRRKFLGKTARTKGNTIMFFRDPFKLVPVKELAEIADKFTRNAIMSPNEIRQTAGMKPSTDPKADELRNRNLNESSEEASPPAKAPDLEPEEKNTE